MAWFQAPAPRIDDDAWRAALDGCPMLSELGRRDAERVRELAEAFIGRKSFEGAGGLEVAPSMAISIAAQACVPLIGLDLDWYRGWRSVIVYPGDFVARHEYVDEAGVVHAYDRALAGESWELGPIVLSWDGVEHTASGREWGNLVIHECAHKLDLLTGSANGMPPIEDARDRKRWTAVMSEAFEELGSIADDLDPDDILVDAAEDPAEFFAVFSEWLHTDPRSLIEEMPEVHAELARFYRRGARA